MNLATFIKWDAYGPAHRAWLAAFRQRNPRLIHSELVPYLIAARHERDLWVWLLTVESLGDPEI